MTARTRAEMLTQITTLLADNASGGISASDVQSVLTDMRDSALAWHGETVVNTVNGGSGAVSVATAAQGALADTAVQPGGLVAEINTQLASAFWQEQRLLTVQTLAANASLVADHIYKVLRTTNTVSLTYTLEPNVMSVGQQVHVVRGNTGSVTFAAGTGVTINSKGGNLSIDAQYDVVSVLCTAADEFLLIGALTSA